MITEEKIYIGDIPCLKISCHEDVKGMVIFYHGWTSTKELQSLRGHILAAYGYDVLIPEAVHHGERGIIDYEDNPDAYLKFWQTIFQNLREAPQVIAYARTWHDDVPLVVMGHSMGGFTALGVLTWNRDVQAAVAMNGSGWWDESDRRFRAGLPLKPMDFLPDLRQEISRWDPYTHTENLEGRSVLALTAGNDDTVHPMAQSYYMDKLYTLAGVRSRFITYPGLKHFVTTNMMGDAVDWLSDVL